MYRVARLATRRGAASLRYRNALNYCHCSYVVSYPDVSLTDENVRANCTLPMVPCGSSPVARLYLAKNEAPEEKACSYV